MEQQEYVFESFWDRAVSARTKIAEIEEGRGSQTTEVIESSARSLAMAAQLIQNAKELLIILSTPNTFRRAVAMDAKDAIPAHKKSAVQLVVETTPCPLMVDADKSRLYEVVSNLLSNAIKFTEQGRIVVGVEKKEYDGKQYANVTVRDPGAGIDPEIMPRLFTKFASKSEHGIGLGLFIAKSIIEAHGGRIWGENNLDGRGATFAFMLPLEG